ncbi:MAG: SEL1-like repeat protein [Verrucomicrobia bacterium]|nr:SEL1-like repeat protein [Verrucomicrobiota bacterium]
MKRAESGSAQAQYDLGLRYLTGDGVEKDDGKAREWLQKSADGGNAQARNKLNSLNAAKL